jgi:Domain of unknown function (DUF5625)
MAVALTHPSNDDHAMKKKIFSLFLALMSMFGIAACEDDKAPTVPVEFPFDMGKVGQVVTQTFTIKKNEGEPITHYVYLVFGDIHTDTRKNAKARAESDAVNKILNLGRDDKGNFFNAAPLTMQITVTRVRDQEVMLKQTTKNPESSSYGYGRYVQIGGVKLTADVYQAQLKYLQGAPDLAKVPTIISIARGSSK